MQDLIRSAMSGRPNELLRRRRLAPRPRAGWAEHPVQCRLASFTDHRTASPLRLRLAVVYAEQPPAASSTNAGGACSARPSGVGLGRHAGTVASARTKLRRPEERQAERAGAADASTLPPSSRRKVKHCSSLYLNVWMLYLGTGYSSFFTCDSFLCVLDPPSASCQRRISLGTGRSALDRHELPVRLAGSGD